MKQILIGNDSSDGMELALNKAGVIEHYTGAEVTFAEVIYDTIEEEPRSVLSDRDKAQMMEAFMSEERHGLRCIAREYANRIATLNTEVVWNKNSAEGIEALAKRLPADLLIKPVSKHRTLTDYIQTPMDWALMRRCECPVLISKAPWPWDRLVLAAVDAGDDSHDKLSEQVLLNAKQFSEILAAKLHVVAAHSDMGQRVSEVQVAMDYDGLKETMREVRLDKLENWNRSLALNAELHVIEGHAASAVSALAEEINATITVVGTAARRGLGKVFMGNTAEDMIRSVNSDILSVRQPD